MELLVVGLYSCESTTNVLKKMLFCQWDKNWSSNCLWSWRLTFRICPHSNYCRRQWNKLAVFAQCTMRRRVAMSFRQFTDQGLKLVHGYRMQSLPKDRIYRPSLFCVAVYCNSFSSRVASFETQNHVIWKSPWYANLLYRYKISLKAFLFVCF